MTPLQEVGALAACALPLEGFFSAPECAQEHVAAVQDSLEPALAALVELMSDGRSRSQRAALRAMAARVQVAELKAGLRAAVEQDRLSRGDCPRRARLYASSPRGSR